jgi:hypothetical protein
MIDDADNRVFCDKTNRVRVQVIFRARVNYRLDVMNLFTEMN